MINPTSAKPITQKLWQQMTEEEKKSKAQEILNKIVEEGNFDHKKARVERVATAMKGDVYVATSK